MAAKRRAVGFTAHYYSVGGKWITSKEFVHNTPLDSMGHPIMRHVVASMRALRDDDSQDAPLPAEWPGPIIITCPECRVPGYLKPKG